MVIPFPRNQDTITFFGQTVKKPINRQDFLMLMKRFLPQDSYQSVCVGIVDKDHYELLDSPLKLIVEAYYKYEF